MPTAFFNLTELYWGLYSIQLGVYCLLFKKIDKREKTEDRENGFEKGVS
jgi:hypothetical protein